MSIEYELKFSATPAQQAAIRSAFPGAYTETPMATTYFDTALGDLSRRHWTLRHRKEGAADVCTLKTPASGGARGEWEVLCGDISEAIPQLSQAAKLPELEALASSGLVVSCGARFTRLSLLLELEGCTAELALDQGVLLGGGKEQPLSEVELELKSGDAAALEAFARRFRDRFGLTAEPRSKFARAKALAQEV